MRNGAPRWLPPPEAPHSFVAHAAAAAILIASPPQEAAIELHWHHAVLGFLGPVRRHPPQLGQPGPAGAASPLPSAVPAPWLRSAVRCSAPPALGRLGAPPSIATPAARELDLETAATVARVSAIGSLPSVWRRVV